MKARTGIYSDPIIAWPDSVVGLGEIIGDLQRLNPNLGLAAIGKYLLHQGSERDVVAIVMPAPPSDELLDALTEGNYDWMPAVGDFHKGARRFERTVDGNLRIRPHTWELEQSGYGQFNRARQPQKRSSATRDQIDRISKRWFIFRPNGEAWAVDFGYMPADYLNETDDRSDSEFWRTVPVGTVCYIDGFDLPVDEHHRRAQEIVSAGSEFAVVADVQKGDLRIFRPDSVECWSEDVCIPEMPWFKIPVPVTYG